MKIKYADIFDRNTGLLTYVQQETLKRSKAAVFGVGGLGGVIAEVLVRSGIGQIVLADRDKYDTSNLNRQIFAFTSTLGLYKVDVAEKFLKEINPDIRIEKYLKIELKNIAAIMNGVDIALLALDDIVPIIIISRYAKKHNITLIEGWALPFGNVRVFNKDTPPLEEVYNLNLKDRDVEEISDNEKKAMNLNMLYELKKINGIQEFYPEPAMQRINEGKIPSFAPMVWLTAVMMSIEAIKIVLDWGTLALSPDFKLYDPFSHIAPKT